jgi:type I restriction enzyme, S subunit
MLTLDVDRVYVNPAATYPIAGVYGFGRGVFAREPITGAETAYRTLNRLRSGQLVMSRLKAFEGAIAIVPEELDGFFVSQEFPTFAIDERSAIPDYLRYLCQWPGLWARLAATSKGLGARRERVHPEQLLVVKVPLPDTSQQRRIVDNLEALFGHAHAIERRLQFGDPLRILTLYPGIIDRILAAEAEEWSPVGAVVEFVNDLVRPGDPVEPAAAFVGLQHIESHTGRRIGSMPLGGERGRKFRFQPGDIVYGYLRPYLNKVWVADMHGLCSVDQYVLRPNNGLPATYLAHALRSRSTLEQAIAFTHSLQLPRLRSGLLASIEIPVIPPERIWDATKSLDRGLAKVIEVRDLRLRQALLVESLRKAALNDAFVGAQR